MTGKQQKSIWYAICVFLSSTGFVSGLLTARYGPRLCGIFGGIIASLGLVISHVVPTIMYLSICVGLTGFGGSQVFISAATGVGMYFSGRVKILALAFITFGAGVGMLLFPIIAEILRTKFGWRGTFLIEAGLILNSVPNSVVFTLPVDLKTNTSFEADHENVSSTPTATKDVRQSIFIINAHNDDATSSLSNNQGFNRTTLKANKNVLTIIKQLCTDKVFVVYALTLSVSVASLNLVMIFIIDYFRSKAIGRTDAIQIYMYLTIGNTLARLFSGFFKQIPHTSALIIPLFGTICGSISSIMFLLTGSSFEFNVIAAFLYGCGFGFTISAMVATTGKIVSQDAYSVGFGTNLTLMGISVLLGGPISGHIRDTTGNYDVLFTSVSVILLIASISFVLIMVYRRRNRRKQPQ